MTACDCKRPAILLVTILALCGCAPKKANLSVTPARDQVARSLASPDEITRILSNDPARAEALLRAALDADPFNGPMHNNLSVALLRQGKLYEAAIACETARKLMPGHPDPRVNLALILEQAGRSEDAINAYVAALEVSPNYIPAMQGLTRVQIASGRTDHRTSTMLHEISLRGETLQWKEWASVQRTRLTQHRAP